MFSESDRQTGKIQSLRHCDHADVPAVRRANYAKRNCLTVLWTCFWSEASKALPLKRSSTRSAWPRKTVYTRYGDKLTLFKSAIQGAIDELVVPFERLRQAEKPELHDTLLTVTILIHDQYAVGMGQRLMRLAQAKLYQMPEIWSYFMDRTVQVTLTYLTDLFARYAISDPDDAALSYYLLIAHGSYQAQSWFSLPEGEFERQLDARVKLFLNGARP